MKTKGVVPLVYGQGSKDQPKSDYTIPALHTSCSLFSSFELNRQPLCCVCSNSCKSKRCAEVP